MLITKRKLKRKSEKDLSKKCNFLPILAKIMPSTENYTKHSNNSISMGTVDVPWDWFVFKMKAC